MLMCPSIIDCRACEHVECYNKRTGSNISTPKQIDALVYFCEGTTPSCMLACLPALCPHRFTVLNGVLCSNSMPEDSAPAAQADSAPADQAAQADSAPAAQADSVPADAGQRRDR